MADINQITTKEDIQIVLNKISELETILNSIINTVKVQATPVVLPKLLRLSEVIELINLSENTIREKVRSGEIIRIEVYSGNFRFPANQFDKIFNQLNNKSNS